MEFSTRKSGNVCIHGDNDELGTDQNSTKADLVEEEVSTDCIGVEIGRVDAE